jgi:hypothetical protein
VLTRADELGILVAESVFPGDWALRSFRKLLISCSRFVGFFGTTNRRQIKYRDGGLNSLAGTTFRS